MARRAQKGMAPPADDAAEEKAEQQPPVKPPFDMVRHKARHSVVWTKKMAWDGLYRECYDYAIPFRRPAKRTQAELRADRLFDNTAIVSTFRFAGQLQQDLFPPGGVFFKLKSGPLVEIMTRRNPQLGQQPGPDGVVRDKLWFDRQLESLTEQILPYFGSGEWDQGINEVCIDLAAGTGTMLILQGTRDRPVRFVTLPIDEIAVERAAYGDVTALFWKTLMTPRSIRGAFPKGVFPEGFPDEDCDAGKLDTEMELNQDFVRMDDGKWVMVAWLSNCTDPIASQSYRTQPFICSCYFRVPGEEYGRGPIMLALPTIKSLNKAMELTLKASAISMLGIWGYRPGGAFNPDTSRLAPGQFWPVGSTGGVMGPDVARLDTASGKLDVANLTLSELRTQVQTALHDEQLPDKGATPISASEVLARMQRVKQNYVGAFGRMIHEIIPVAVMRVADILYGMQLLDVQVTLDNLLMSLEIVSPLATALKADKLEPMMRYLQLLEALQQPPQRYVKFDDLLTDIGGDLDVGAKYLTTPQERAAFDQQQQAQQTGQQIADFATKNPEVLTQALGIAPTAPGQPTPMQ